MTLNLKSSDQTSSNLKSGLLIVALALGIKSLLLDYDYLDVYLTLGLQGLFEDHTRWAEHLTQMAKWPFIVVPFFIALVFAQLRFGVRFLPVIPLSLILCIGLDYLLKLYVYVDKPDSELVYVSHISLASGWPSTFGVVFGSLFGLFLFPLRGPILLSGNSSNVSRKLVYHLTQLCSFIILVSGIGARIVLGGHWPTQVLSSMLFGILASIYLKDVWARLQQH